MNKFLKYFLKPVCMLILLALISACEGKEDELPKEINLLVSKSNISVSKDAQDYELRVKSNAKWTATSSQTWCKLQITSGQGGTLYKVMVNIDENSSYDERTAQITIQSGDSIQNIVLKQSHTFALILNKTSIDVSSDREIITVKVDKTDPYSVTPGASWISATSPALKALSSDELYFQIEKNAETINRTAQITFKLGGIEKTITINQAAAQIKPPTNLGMERTAKELAAQMALGWNLGNALEACSSPTSASELLWGNPKTTKALIDAVKAAGFNTVRIPCAWSGYIEDQTTHRIKSSWLTRVKEVVDYCKENDMYVILNIHWDGGWLENNPVKSMQTAINAKQRALWRQIALFFEDYDDHLLFAGTNEVGHSGSAPTSENHEVQESFNQTFVDAVRETGGKNAYRTLIIQTYSTDINLGTSTHPLAISTDNVQNRMMVEIHYYDPWNFCGLEQDVSWGNMAFLWGADYLQFATGAVMSGRFSTWGLEDHVISQFKKVKASFVDKGYPVIMGEYGPTRRLTFSGNDQINHLNSRAFYLKYVTREAKNHGLVPIYWDNGGTGDKASGIFNRATNSISDQQAVNAILQGAAEGVYPY